jgi:hypothetical protein
VRSFPATRIWRARSLSQGAFCFFHLSPLRPSPLSSSRKLIVVRNRLALSIFALASSDKRGEGEIIEMALEYVNSMEMPSAHVTRHWLRIS